MGAANFCGFMCIGKGNHPALRAPLHRRGIFQLLQNDNHGFKIPLLRRGGAKRRGGHLC